MKASSRYRNDDSLPSFVPPPSSPLSVCSQQIKLNFVIPMNPASHYSRTGRAGYVSNIRKNDIKHAIFSKWICSNARHRHDDDSRTQQNTAAQNKNWMAKQSNARANKIWVNSSTQPMRHKDEIYRVGAPWVRNKRRTKQILGPREWTFRLLFGFCSGTHCERAFACVSDAVQAIGQSRLAVCALYMLCTLTNSHKNVVSICINSPVNNFDCSDTSVQF